MLIYQRVVILWLKSLVYQFRANNLEQKKTSSMKSPFLDAAGNQNVGDVSHMFRHVQYQSNLE